MRQAGARQERGARRAGGAARAARAADYRHLVNPFEPLRVFSDDQVEAIHGAALRVLEEIGVRVLLGEARERLRAVARGHHLVAALLQRIREQRLDGLLVVDEQDPRGTLGHAP